jgi:hypothetical protein
MRRLSVLVVLASCSSRDSHPEPAPAPGDRPPVLDEEQKQAVVREIVRQAPAEPDARTTSCKLPATIDRAEVTGTVRVIELGGKTVQLADGDLEGGELALHAGRTIRTGRTAIRPRRDTEDFDRPIVIELYDPQRTLDAVAGTLVIDTTKPVLAGRIENADFRERREDFAYVTNGCTAHVGRIDFRFDMTAR